MDPGAVYELAPSMHTYSLQGVTSRVGAGCALG